MAVLAGLPQGGALEGVFHIGVSPGRKQQRDALIKTLDGGKVQGGTAVIVSRVDVKALLDVLGDALLATLCIRC